MISTDPREEPFLPAASPSPQAELPSSAFQPPVLRDSSTPRSYTLLDPPASESFLQQFLRPIIYILQVIGRFIQNIYNYFSNSSTDPGNSHERPASAPAESESPPFFRPASAPADYEENPQPSLLRLEHSAIPYQIHDGCLPQSEYPMLRNESELGDKRRLTAEIEQIIRSRGIGQTFSFQLLSGEKINLKDMLARLAPETLLGINETLERGSTEGLTQIIDKGIAQQQVGLEQACPFTAWENLKRVLLEERGGYSEKTLQECLEKGSVEYQNHVKDGRRLATEEDFLPMIQDDSHLQVAPNSDPDLAAAGIVQMQEQHILPGQETASYQELLQQTFLSGRHPEKSPLKGALFTKAPVTFAIIYNARDDSVRIIDSHGALKTNPEASALHGAFDITVPSIEHAAQLLAAMRPNVSGQREATQMFPVSLKD